jgi:hypothetical protein
VFLKYRRNEDCFEDEVFSWDFDEVKENQNLKGPKFSFAVPEIYDKVMIVCVKIDGRDGLASSYTLCVRKD